MENLELYVNSINEIFSYLDSLDQNLENEENSLNVKNLNEYKELSISFAKLIGANVSNSEPPKEENTPSQDDSLMPNSNDIELDEEDEEEGDSNDW